MDFGKCAAEVDGKIGDLIVAHTLAELAVNPVGKKGCDIHSLGIGLPDSVHERIFELHVIADPYEQGCTVQGQGNPEFQVAGEIDSHLFPDRVERFHDEIVDLRSDDLLRVTALPLEIKGQIIDFLLFDMQVEFSAEFGEKGIRQGALRFQIIPDLQVIGHDAEVVPDPSHSDIEIDDE